MSGGLWGILSWSEAKDSKPKETKPPSSFFRTRWSQLEETTAKPDVLEEIQNAMSTADAMPSWSSADFSSDEKVGKLFPILLFLYFCIGSWV